MSRTALIQALNSDDISVKIRQGAKRPLVERITVGGAFEVNPQSYKVTELRSKKVVAEIGDGGRYQQAIDYACATALRKAMA